MMKITTLPQMSLGDFKSVTHVKEVVADMMAGIMGRTMLNTMKDTMGDVVKNELLVGAVAICKRFKISRARLRYWEELGAPLYRRGVTENAPVCVDYHALVAWERTMALAHSGRLCLPESPAGQVEYPAGQVEHPANQVKYPASQAEPLAYQSESLPHQAEHLTRQAEHLNHQQGHCPQVW